MTQAGYDHNRACSYSTANRDTLSLILTPLGEKRAEAQQLLNRHRNVRLGKQWAYWYRTPARFIRPHQAGTLSLLKGNLLVLIVVRLPSDPKPTALRAMTAILPRL